MYMVKTATILRRLWPLMTYGMHLISRPTMVSAVKLPLIIRPICMCALRAYSYKLQVHHDVLQHALAPSNNGPVLPTLSFSLLC